PNKEKQQKNSYSVKFAEKENTLSLVYKTDYNRYVQLIVNAKRLENDTKKDFAGIERKIYILDENNKVIIPKDYDPKYVEKLLKKLPGKLTPGKAEKFYFKKNEPNIVIKMQDTDWKIIVTTPKVLSKYSINVARYKIISILAITAGIIILLCLIYLLYLYTNLRQLFKAIHAVADGNYNRKVRPIVNFTTPNEIIFLSKEFNKMVEKIKASYKELKKKNQKLKQLDNFKSNLIDTVSHEFRTPLTSIKGYTSRLLRQDVVIDKQMQTESLKIIKRQAERLERMVEDLLVIPDIETSSIKFFPQEINIKEIIDNVLQSVEFRQNRDFVIQVAENTPNIYADPDRVEQIIINLLKNAIKYSQSLITITSKQLPTELAISIENESKTVDKKILNTLFDKFTRIDSSTTRTTRGTGLGLFIVKGLVEAMDGRIKLSSDNNFKVTFTLPLAK
ncbi:MAG: HAMP domain-containing sensor histidine kinase, partial [Candidatus Gastranaerophilales bacterium]|nr:HAMP domain-containing sensor histidine kinase [Candidatus Gastranaerophilales bacterium]